MFVLGSIKDNPENLHTDYIIMKNKKWFITELLNKNSKQIFLIDATGALLSTVFLLLILAQFESYFGIPIDTLYILSFIAFCLFIYSSTCFWFVKSRWKSFLRIIIILNSIYAVISITLILKHYEQLTKLGLIYFIFELLIIALIIIMEWKTLSYKNLGKQVE